MELIKPHNTPPKTVENSDILRVLQEAPEMEKLCDTPIGNYNQAYAIAHPQVTKDNPLTFFVLATGHIIINPKITRHTKHPVNSEEGCMSFSTFPLINTPRYNKIEVTYEIIEDHQLVTKREKLSGKVAKIFQHEIQHLQEPPNQYIYKRKEETT